MSKKEWKDVTDMGVVILPQLQALQLKVKFKEKYEVDEIEKFYIVTYNPKQILAEVYLLQNKKKIKKLYDFLNLQMCRRVFCCICGEKWTSMPQPFGYCDTIQKCCRRHRYIGKCADIREALFRFLKILLNKIEKIERRFICEYCKKKYKPTRSDSKFCSGKCRVTSHRKYGGGR